MYITEEQKGEKVKEVISRAKELLFRAELVNKGMHVHAIISCMSVIKLGLKLYEGEITYNSEGYCVLDTESKRLAGLLYYTEHKL